MTRTKRHAPAPAAPVAARSIPRLSATIAALALLSACLIWWNGRSPSAPPQASAPAAEAGVSTNQAPVSLAPSSAFQKLLGKWLRPDGGYIVEVRNIEDGGKLQLAYFNPRPIHVSKGEARIEAGEIKVFIELQDVNYPGCTYNLGYDASRDELVGIYYQAALKERFEVRFERAQ